MKNKLPPITFGEIIEKEFFDEWDKGTRDSKLKELAKVLGVSEQMVLNLYYGRDGDR